MNLPSTVFITGANGYIGGSIAEKLVKNGSRVRGLVRSQANAELLVSHGIAPVIGDLNDEDLLIREAQNAESKLDFIHKFKIAAKEADETDFWLLLCQSSKSYPSCENLLEKSVYIQKTINKIISTSKKKLNN